MEVRDVRPPAAVALGELHRITEHRRLRRYQCSLKSSTASSPCSRRAVCTASSNRFIADLAEHRRDLAFEIFREQREPLRGIGRGREQAPECHRLAEHRRGLGQREWSPLVEHTLRPREGTREPWPSSCASVSTFAPARRPVEQHVRVMRRNRVRARTRPTACRTHRRVDPLLVEEPLAIVARSGENDRVGIEYELAGLRRNRTPLPTTRSMPYRS